MYSDVVQLRDFYASRTGQVARHLIRRAVRSFWSDVTDDSILGLGYAVPYLRQFRGEAERVVACMPAQQGAMHWPPEGPYVVALGEETELPFADSSIDRILLVHGIEESHYVREMLSEIWRVLAGQGRLLVVVPNRRGIWARLERTPFGHGQPFSPEQIRKLLKANAFIPEREEQALFVPPTRSQTLLRAAAAWERAGGRWFRRFGGVNLVEARKQVFAVRPARAVARRRRVLIAVPNPALAGGTAGARTSRCGPASSPARDC